MEANNQLKQPFFAKFLQGQNPTARKASNAEQHFCTSVCEDDDIIVVTMKFPSDGDEFDHPFPLP